MKLIDVKNVWKIYNEGYENEVRALADVSLEIDRREFVAIIGQSGSGKSTLMNISAASMCRHTGSITLTVSWPAR